MGISVKIRKLSELREYGFNLEEITAYGTKGSAGFDLVCAERHGVRIAPFASKLIPTGISIELPLGTFGLLRPRSFLGLGNVGMLSSGVIDEDYRGEILVNLYNFDKEDVEFFEGQRIAQLVVLPYRRVKLDWVSEELTSTERGSGGHGSTGS